MQIAARQNMEAAAAHLGLRHSAIMSKLFLLFFLHSFFYFKCQFKVIQNLLKIRSIVLNFCLNITKILLLFLMSILDLQHNNTNH